MLQKPFRKKTNFLSDIEQIDSVKQDSFFVGIETTRRVME